ECQLEELPEGGRGGRAAPRRPWKPDGGLSRRNTQQRGALFDHRSGGAAGAKGKGLPTFCQVFFASRDSTARQGPVDLCVKGDVVADHRACDAEAWTAAL